MSRRALTPAARGVVLAVRAALRAGRVDLADQADGSTLATSTAPDGTVLLRAVLRLPVPGAADPRQLTLPAVAPVPQPAEAPPAPVAVPAGEVPAPEAPAPQGVTVRCWIAQRDWDAAQFRDAEAEGWLTEPVAGTVLDWTDAAPWETALVPAGMLDALRKASRRVGVTLYEGGDTPPAPAKPAPEPEDARPEPVRVNGLAPGDLIEMDGARATVGGVDHEGFAWCETNAKGYLTGPVERVLWREVEHLGGNRWRVRPVETETPSQKAKREKAAKPKRAKVVAPVEAAPVGVHGLVLGGTMRVDGVLCEVRGVDADGPSYCPVGVGTSEGFVAALWTELTHLGDDRWETSPELRAAITRGDTKPPKPLLPARRHPVPEADAIAQSYRGAITIVWQVAEGAAWERVWSEPSPKAAAIESAWQAACEAHRARQYNRGGKCTRDSRDGAK